MIFVELPKFKKKLEDLQTLTEKWIFFMKEVPSLELIPPTLGEIPEMEKALNIASRANLSVDELDKLDRREMFLEDQRVSIVLALQEGEEKGRVKGQKEGQLRVIFQILGRLGELSMEIEREIEQLSPSELDELVKASLNFSSLEDLENWLRTRN
ncbi:MAG: DUF4351 domain-containing protein [Spirulina sp.]